MDDAKVNDLVRRLARLDYSIRRNGYKDTAIEEARALLIKVCTLNVVGLTMHSKESVEESSSEWWYDVKDVRRYIAAFECGDRI